MQSAPPSTALRRTSSAETATLSSPQFNVRAVDRDATLPLRHTVLRPDAPLSDVEFPGDAAEGALHVGAFVDGELVAVGTISPEARSAEAPGGAAPTAPRHTDTAWRVRGMATAEWVRGHGAGTRVLDACVAHAREQGGSVVWCNARVGAVRFYERAGWETLSREFDISGAGLHVVMERRLDD
ncbi:MAG: family N-acetyltransferase [Thermoleophilia bacterium]|nr:family N-acetyltransferase [Thermoleophilia bacterium]